eukprot:505484_1
MHKMKRRRKVSAHDLNEHRDSIINGFTILQHGNPHHAPHKQHKRHHTQWIDAQTNSMSKHPQKSLNRRKHRFIDHDFTTQSTNRTKLVFEKWKKSQENKHGKCHLCQSNVVDMKHHLESICTNKIIACNLCGDKIKRCDWHSHVQSNCDGYQYMCVHDGCDVTLSNRNDWYQHSLCHDTEKDSQCGLCGKQVKDLREHWSQDCNGYEYICDYDECNATFKDRNQLYEHMSLHGTKFAERVDSPRDYMNYDPFNMHNICSLCTSRVPIGCMEDHLIICSKAPIECSLCHQKVLRCNLRKHWDNECNCYEYVVHRTRIYDDGEWIYAWGNRHWYYKTETVVFTCKDRNQWYENMSLWPIKPSGSPRDYMAYDPFNMYNVCSLCGSRVAIGCMDDHLIICTKASIECSLCNQNVIRCDLRDHWAHDCVGYEYIAHRKKMNNWGWYYLGGASQSAGIASTDRNQWYENLSFWPLKPTGPPKDYLSYDPFDMYNVCPLCTLRVPVGCMEDHLVICLNAPIECSLCKQKVLRCKLREHWNRICSGYAISDTPLSMMRRTLPRLYGKYVIKHWIRTDIEHKHNVRCYVPRDIMRLISNYLPDIHQLYRDKYKVLKY